jgi:hypothetical protein
VVGLGLRAFLNALPTALFGLNVAITTLNNIANNSITTANLASVAALSGFPQDLETANPSTSYAAVLMDLTRTLVSLAENMNAISAALLPAREVNEEYLRNCKVKGYPSHFSFSSSSPPSSLSSSSSRCCFLSMLLSLKLFLC